MISAPPATQRKRRAMAPGRVLTGEALKAKVTAKAKSGRGVASSQCLEEAPPAVSQPVVEQPAVFDFVAADIEIITQSMPVDEDDEALSI